MNASQTIQVAIDKLEAERAKAMQGPWFRLHPLAIVKVQAQSAQIVAGQAFDDHNADLIVTLHRTIDAQLAILRRHKDLAEAIGEHYPISYEDFGVLDLARAILGEVS